MKTTAVQRIARVAIGLFMIGAGIAHLTFLRKDFQAQVPRWLPTHPAFMDFVVVSSGIVEIALGLAMIFAPAQHRAKAGLALAVFYVLIFPGNISQYTNQISAFGLDTNHKRFMRLFFQPVLIVWALWASGSLQKKLAQNKTT